LEHGIIRKRPAHGVEIAAQPGRIKPAQQSVDFAPIRRPPLTCNQPASATARRASTPTRWARYSALPWMSPARPSAGIVSPSSDFGETRLLSAASNSGTRNTPDAPAPVTATRTSEGRLATNTPTSAKRDAGLRNFL